jgi:hypothetical protein
MISHYSIKSIFFGIIKSNRQQFLFHYHSSLTDTNQKEISFDNFFDNILPYKLATIAQSFGIAIIDKARTLPQKISIFIYYNNSNYSLLFDSKKKLCDSHWPLFVIDKIYKLTVITLPKIIGCGLIIRHFDLNITESLIMFFKTELIKKSRNVAMLLSKNRLFPHFDFVIYALHVTHTISATLSEHEFR